MRQARRNIASLFFGAFAVICLANLTVGLSRVRVIVLLLPIVGDASRAGIARIMSIAERSEQAFGACYLPVLSSHASLLFRC